MWIYRRKLVYPVRICKRDVNIAKLLIEQYGGPYGELSAAMLYLNQRYNMDNYRVRAILTDIGTEELDHLEIIAEMISRLIKNVSPEKMKEAGLGGWYAQHGNGLSYTDSNGTPWSAGYIGTTGDPMADILGDLAAEERARASYEHLIDLIDDPDIIETLRFLRQREIVHFQRFGEALEILERGERSE